MGAGLLGPAEPAVWLVQEHRLGDGHHGLAKARLAMEAKGWGTVFSAARTTDKASTSGGVAVLWRKEALGCGEAAEAVRQDDCFRVATASLVVGAVPLQVVSLYGDVRCRQVTEGLLEMLVGRARAGELLVIGGDFNITAAEAMRFLGGSGELDVVCSGQPTCFSSCGPPSEIDFFLVSKSARRLVRGCVVMDCTSLAVHRPVVLSMAVGGRIAPLTKWVRPKAPVAEAMARIVGPANCHPDLLAGVLEQPSWEPVVGGVRLAQEEVEEAWRLWLRMAAAELQDITKLGTEELAAPYTFQDFDPLAEVKARRRQALEGAQLFCWCDRRLAEAISMAKEERWHGWSSRTAVSLAGFLGHSAAPLGRLIEVFRQPWSYGAAYLIHERGIVKEQLQVFLEVSKAEAISRWRKQLNERAEAGTREAFRFLRQADDVNKEVCGAGVAQVLERNAAVWGSLWGCQGGPSGAEQQQQRQHTLDTGWTADSGPRWQARRAALGCRIEIYGAEVWRALAATFPCTTACPDGLPLRCFRHLSDKLLDYLGILAAGMVASGRWPVSEMVTMVVLIPKAAGGERPIALFRSMVRLIAKAYAQQSEGWLRSATPVYLNTARGRRVGDGMWRQQVRAAFAHDSGGAAAEVAVDVCKAFENVRHELLLREAEALGYPWAPLLMALDMYSWARRLVFRGCVAGSLFPTRGIGAGSAFATRELFVVMSATLARLHAQYSTVYWNVQVDDISATVPGRSEAEVTLRAVEVFRAVRTGLADGCGLPLSDGKTTVVATSSGLAAAVCQGIGKCAEVGAWCRKLGADYGLWVDESSGHGASRARRGSRKAAGRRFASKVAGAQGWRAGRECRRLVRSSRFVKAARRAARVKVVAAKHRRRLLAAAILPVALYAAEHVPWSAGEVLHLANMAVRTLGLSVIGVPYEVSRLLLPVDLDPGWKVAWAAVERWHREVWISRHRQPGAFPADALVEGELFWAWELGVAAGGREVGSGWKGSPALAAIAAALGSFRLRWTEPAVLTCIDTGQVFCLADGSPAMLRKLLRERWDRTSHGLLAKLLEDRATVLGLQCASSGQEGGSAAVGSLLGCQVDFGKVAGILRSRAVSLHAKQVLLLVMWGTLPCGSWLRAHGWALGEGSSLCEICGEADGFRHCLVGCEAGGPDGGAEAAGRVGGWKVVLAAPCGQGGGRLAAGAGSDEGPEPKRRRLRGKQHDPEVGVLSVPRRVYSETFGPGEFWETRNGFPVPFGTVRFTRGARLFTDGSAVWPGHSFAAAACAVVEKRSDGFEQAVQVSLPPEWPASAVAAEMYAVMVALAVLGRGSPDGCPHEPGSVTLVADCAAVIKIGNMHPSGQLHEKSVFAGCWEECPGGPIGRFVKVAAHRPRSEAAAEGWLEDWIGNDLADVLAKDARPAVIGSGSAWVAADRTARSRLEALVEFLPVGFHRRPFGMARTAGVRQLSRQVRPRRAHAYAFVGGFWACMECGSVLRARPRGAGLAGPGCPGRPRALRLAHPSHWLRSGFVGHGPAVGVSGGPPFTICTKCGFFATARVAGLRKQCAGMPELHRVRGLERVARGLHPVYNVPVVLAPVSRSCFVPPTAEMESPAVLDRRSVVGDWRCMEAWASAVPCDSGGPTRVLSAGFDDEEGGSFFDESAVGDDVWGPGGDGSRWSDVETAESCLPPPVPVPGGSFSPRAAVCSGEPWRTAGCGKRSPGWLSDVAAVGTAAGKRGRWAVPDAEVGPRL
jgi:hypothetical protein